MYPQNRQPRVSIFLRLIFGSFFQLSVSQRTSAWAVYKKQPKNIQKERKLINHPTDHFDFDGAITLASFGEHITGSLAEIAKFCGTISLLWIKELELLGGGRLRMK